MTGKRPPRVAPVSITVESAPLAGRHWTWFAAVLSLAAALFLLAAWGVPRYPLSSDLVTLLSDSVFEEDLHSYARILGDELAEADVIVLGSSNAHMALPAADVLTVAYREGTGRSGRVEKITTAGQTLLDALFYMSEARLSDGQLVVIHVSPSLFARSLEDERIFKGVHIQPPLGLAVRFGQRVPELAKFLDPEIRIATGLHSLKSLTHRIFANLPGNLVKRELYGLPLAAAFRQKTEPSRPFVEGTVPDTIAKTRLQIESMLREQFPLNRGYNYQLLDTVLALLDERKVRAVLMETTLIDGDEVGYLEPFWQPYQQMVSELAAKHSIQYVDLNPEVALNYGDFVDARHTTSSGREKWSERFLGWLVHEQKSGRRN